MLFIDFNLFVLLSKRNIVSSVNFISVATEQVLVDEISYPSKITAAKSLSLLGHGKLVYLFPLLAPMFLLCSYEVFFLI